MYINKKGERVYSEIYNSKHFAHCQDLIGNDGKVLSVILASDKTALSTLSGDASAWPLYLSIGNIDKSIRQNTSTESLILIGLLPNLKGTKSEKRKIKIIASR